MSEEPREAEELAPRGVRIAGLVLAAALFAALLAIPIPGLAPAGQATLAVTAVVACLWLSQAVPIPAASLVPLVLFPLLGVASTKDVARLYVNENSFLFLGGFLLALAVERSGLHRRVALTAVRAVGSGPRRLAFAFMGLSTCISLFISNTATTLMLLPIALAVVRHVEDRVEKTDAGEARAFRNFAVLVLLGVAYGSSIGGMGTPIGTPPNALFLGHVASTFPDRPDLEVSFAAWMVAMLPLVAVFAPLAWLVMERVVLPVRGLARTFERGLSGAGAPEGRLGRDERVVAAVFVTTALLWVFRADIDVGALRIPGWTTALGLPSGIHDGTVAMLAALVLFFVPSERGGRLLDWSVESKVPWGILLLFGAGFAIAGQFEATGLAAWSGDALARHLPGSPLAAALLTAVVVTLLSELCNNTATAAILLPVATGVAAGAGLHPFALALPATLAASSGFMLPVATAPNAIVFATGRIRVGQMVTAGLLLDVLGALLIAGFAATWWTWLFAR